MNRVLKAIAAIMLMMVVAVGCNKPEEPADHSGSFNGHDYIDLGLPSGTLWATCNVGADTPEGYGDYFAWGEIQPKTTYKWGTYKYCMGGGESLTKYCYYGIGGYNGFSDTLIILLPEDDAATVNWGVGWRMPTNEEWQELYNNTIQTWITLAGVNGRLLSASNGGSLFLPAAGFCWDDELWLDGGHGLYWSSSLDTAYPLRAWYFNFISDDYVMHRYYRCDGHPIRAVCSKRN